MNVWQEFPVRAQAVARAGQERSGHPFTEFFPFSFYKIPFKPSNPCLEYEENLHILLDALPAMRPHRHRADAPPSPTHRQGHSTPSHRAATAHDACRRHPAPAYRNGHGRHGAAQQLADQPLRGLSDL